MSRPLTALKAVVLLHHRKGRKSAIGLATSKQKRADAENAVSGCRGLLRMVLAGRSSGQP